MNSVCDRHAWRGRRARKTEKALSPGLFRSQADKPDSVVGSHPSRPHVAVRLEPPTRGSASSFTASVWRCTGWGLPSRRVSAPLVRSYRTFSPLPATLKGHIGGVLSVALSVGFPRLGVTQHPCSAVSGLSSCPKGARDCLACRLRIPRSRVRQRGRPR